MPKPRKKIKKLSAKEQLFVNLYNVDPNADKAAVSAGYAKTTARTRAPLWVSKDRRSCPLNKRHVWDAVQKAREAAGKRCNVTVDRIVVELCKIAFANADEFYNWIDGEGYLKPSHELTMDQKAAVASVVQKVNKAGRTVEVKLYDKQKALDMLARITGAYNDSLKVTGDLAEAVIEARKRHAAAIADGGVSDEG